MDGDDGATWVDVGSIDDVGASPQRVEVDGTAIVVARLGDQVLAAVDRCPHRVPLSAGTVEHDCLVCPYHGWSFDAAGEVVAIPALGVGARLPKRARLRTASVSADDAGHLRIDSATVAPVEAPARSVANDDDGLRAGWHPVARSAEVAAGGSVDLGLLGTTWTVQRDPMGQLTCDGAHAVVDHVGHVWIAPDQPATGLLAIPEVDDVDWHHVPMPRVEGRYGMGLLLDNQLDAGHFPFVHRGTFGTAPGQALPSYDVDRDGLGFEVRLRVPIAARNDVRNTDGTRPLTQHRTMTYRYRAPSTLFLRLDYEEMGGSTGILFCFTPLDADTTRMDVDLLFHHPDGFTDEQLAERLAFEVSVVAEDLALQDRFEFTDLPLELTAEIHTKADRAAVELRRILTELMAAPAQSATDAA